MLCFPSAFFWRDAGHSSRAVWGINCLRSLERWDHWFESHLMYGCLECVCVYCVCVVLCLGSGFVTRWSLVQGVLPSVKKWLRNWIRGLGSEWTGRAIETNSVDEIWTYLGFLYICFCINLLPNIPCVFLDGICFSRSIDQNLMSSHSVILGLPNVLL
jgi:hypothetical protein